MITRAKEWLRDVRGRLFWTLAGWLLQPAIERPADFNIGGKDNPYLRRWFLLPRNRVFNAYLHNFRRSDMDGALHDHPWLFSVSLVLWGEYREHTIERGGIHRRRPLRAGQWKLRIASSPHRVELLEADVNRPFSRSAARRERECWTLFVTGPKVREWGFHCPERGWVHWQKYTAEQDSGSVGAGCGAEGDQA